jgi:hypothetical protein
VLYRSPAIKNTCQWWTLYFIQHLVRHGQTQDEAMTALRGRIRGVLSSSTTDSFFARRILDEFVTDLAATVRPAIDGFARAFGERRQQGLLPPSVDGVHVCISGRMPKTSADEQAFQ